MNFRPDLPIDAPRDARPKYCAVVGDRSLTARAAAGLRGFVGRTWWVVALLGVAVAVFEGGDEEHLSQATGAVDIAGLAGDEVLTEVLAYAADASCGSDCPGTTSIWLAAADGSSPVELTNPGTGSDRHPRWAPDGSALAFVRAADGHSAGQLMVMELDDSTVADAVPLVDTHSMLGGAGCDADLLEPVWSPDSQLIAATCTRDDASSVVVRSMTAGSAFEIPRDANTAEGEPSWSPDSGRLAFTRRDLDVSYGDPGRLTVWTAALAPTGATDVRRLISGEVAVSAPSWSPDGQRIAFVERNERMLATTVATILLRTGEVEQRWTKSGHDPVQPYELAWSPDGSSVAFPAGDGLTLSTITLLAVDDNRERTLPAGSRLSFSPRWSSDGRSVVYEEVDGDQRALKIFRVDRGTLATVAGIRTAFDGAWGLIPTPRKQRASSTTLPINGGTITVQTAPTVPTVPSLTLPSNLPNVTIPPLTVPTLPPVTLPPVTTPTLPGLVPDATIPSSPSVPTTLPGTPTVPGAVPTTVPTAPVSEPVAPSVPGVSLP